MTKTITIETFKQDKSGLVKDGIRELNINKMKPYQFIQVTTIIKSLIDDLNQDDNIRGTLAGLFDNVDEDSSISEVLQVAGSQFIQDGAGSIGLLLQVAPLRAFELIAVLASTTPGELEVQEMDTFFDIVDAVIEENDFSKVIDRVKKSGKLLTNSLKFKEKLQAVK